jgi:hypothetical protein
MTQPVLLLTREITGEVVEVAADPATGTYHIPAGVFVSLRWNPSQPDNPRLCGYRA